MYYSPHADSRRRRIPSLPLHRPQDHAPPANFSLPALGRFPHGCPTRITCTERISRNFTILLRDAGFQSVIGQAGYRTLWTEGTRNRGELGLILAHAQQGRGLAWDVHLLVLTLGFEELGLEVVEWVTAEANEGMRAVLVKMGCKDEGVFLEEGRDQWGTLVKYSLEKKDWAECKVWLRERVDRLAGS